MSTEGQMSIEDRVRTATRAGASLIRDVRPLDAPAPVRLRRRPGPAPRRWVNWGVPLAAAAAVAAIALTLVAVRQAGTPSPAASGSATAAPAAVPRYYATVVYNAHVGLRGPLIVGDDVTGKVIDTFSPPPGLVFTNVRGTFDDRTFIVQAAVDTPPYGAPPYSWYLLRIAPGSGHPDKLTKLPVKLPGDRTFALAYAPSPDGRELAVESVPGNPGASSVTTLAIYSVSTGARLHAWTAPTQEVTSVPPVHTLDWPYGGKLVFSAAGPSQQVQQRALDVTGAGTDLVADSRVLLTAGNPGSSNCGSLQITPDGGTAVCAAGIGPGATTGNDTGCANGAPRFTAFPLPISRQPGRVLYQYRGVCQDSEAFTLWTGASASSIIGVTRMNVANEATKTKEVYAIGEITGGRFRPLNVAKTVAPDTYVDLAF